MDMDVDVDTPDSTAVPTSPVPSVDGQWKWSKNMENDVSEHVSIFGFDSKG